MMPGDLRRYETCVVVTILHAFTILFAVSISHIHGDEVLDKVIRENIAWRSIHRNYSLYNPSGIYMKPSKEWPSAHHHIAIVSDSLNSCFE